MVMVYLWESGRVGNRHLNRKGLQKCKPFFLYIYADGDGEARRSRLPSGQREAQGTPDFRQHYCGVPLVILSSRLRT